MRWRQNRGRGCHPLFLYTAGQDKQRINIERGGRRAAAPVPRGPAAGALGHDVPRSSDGPPEGHFCDVCGHQVKTARGVNIHKALKHKIQQPTKQKAPGVSSLKTFRQLPEAHMMGHTAKDDQKIKRKGNRASLREDSVPENTKSRDTKSRDMDCQEGESFGGGEEAEMVDKDVELGTVGREEEPQGWSGRLRKSASVRGVRFNEQRAGVVDILPSRKRKTPGPPPSYAPSTDDSSTSSSGNDDLYVPPRGRLSSSSSDLSSGEEEELVPPKASRPIASVGTRARRLAREMASSEDDSDSNGAPSPKLRRKMAFDSHAICPECGRAFSTKVGLSLHRRRRHFERYNADICVHKIKPRWSKEEDFLLATEEARLTRKAVKNINERLHKKFRYRTFDSIKSHRKTPKYRLLVKQRLEELEAGQPGLQPADQDNSSEGEPPHDDVEHSTDEPEGSIETEPPTSRTVTHRDKVREEIGRLTTKQPPRGYDGPRLWEIAKRHLQGEKIDTVLNNYIRDTFYKDERGKPAREVKYSTSFKGSKKAFKKHEYARIQNSYAKDRGSCAREVLDGRKTTQVEYPEVFLREWKDIMEATTPASITTPLQPATGEIDPFTVITARDIKAAMPSAGSAPGPDGFTGEDLRTCPMVILQVLFNLLILQGGLPVSLQGARTTFIPKITEASSPSDFRPITVSSILVRTLHKILARRILEDVDLDVRQRAFIPVDGCADNIAILATVLYEAKNKYKSVHLASLDMAKAFDRVTKEAILRGARRKGLSEDFIRYLDVFYDTSTTVLSFHGHSLLAKPARGVRQGDPLSPLLFNMVLDEWISSLPSQIAFRSGDFQLNAMAFADDVIIATSTATGLQQTLHGFEEFLTERGLNLNPKKCITLSLEANAKEKKTKILTEANFRIAGQQVPAMDTKSAWRYLGISFHALGVKATPILEELKDYLKKVSTAPLKPQQRIMILRCYLLPRLYHRLIFEPISGKMLTKMDRTIRLNVRHWLRLPHDVPLGFYHARNAEGGLGITSLRTSIPWMRLQRMSRLDQSTSTMSAAASKLGYITSILKQAKQLIMYKETAIESRKTYDKFWTRTLHTSADGAALKDAATTPGGTSWLVDGSRLLTGREYINTVKMYINAMPCLTRLKRGRDVRTTCRAGCPEPENLGHILQKCLRTHHARIHRHNIIAKYVANRLRDLEYQVLEEPHYKVPGTALVPDIVFKREDKSGVLDVQVVSTRQPLGALHATKTSKYMNEAFLKQAFPHEHPLVSSVTLNYRGMWANESVKTLRDLGFTRRDFKLLTIRCLQGGYRGFVAHQRMTTAYSS